MDASVDVGCDSSIAMDSDDHPHIAYYDRHWENLKYAQWTGSAWSIVTVESPWDVGQYPSLALDSNNYPHISYWGNHPVSSLKYAQWTGTSWSIETVHASAYVDDYSSLALDSLDNAHIGYTVNAGTADDDLGYAKWTGVAWSIETVDSTGWTGEVPSLALDSNNYPHISYYKQYVDDLRYARWTGTAWSLETVESTGYAGMQSSIALDSNDNPHISYTHGSLYEYQNRTLKYAQWTGTSWSIETVDSTGDVGLSPSLALDSSGNPHISYIDWTNRNLKYARWTGSAWSIEVVDPIGDSQQFGLTSLALDSEDRPHISYYDATNKNLKYATTSDEYFTSVNVTPFDSDDDGQNDAVMAQMNVDTSYSGTVRITVHAFLVDPSSHYADLKSSSWNITGQVVDWMHPNATVTLYVPAGYSAGSANYMLMLTLFDGDGFLEDSYQQTNIFLHPSSTPPPTPMIESCNLVGERKDSFELGEIVFVNGSGFSPSTGYPLYVVVDQATWTDGMVIPERVPGTEPGVASTAQGVIDPTDVWHNPQAVGNYDIIVDVNGNGQYDAGIDALDDGDVEITAGVSVIPEFSTILPFLILATSLSAILLKKKICQ